MADGQDIFAGDDPIAIAKRWLGEAKVTEPNDANAIALATSDAQGMPNVRMVLLKEIEDAKKNVKENEEKIVSIMEQVEKLTAETTEEKKKDSSWSRLSSGAASNRYDPWRQSKKTPSEPKDEKYDHVCNQKELSSWRCLPYFHIAHVAVSFQRSLQRSISMQA